MTVVEASAVGIGPHRPIAHPAAEDFGLLDVVGAEGAMSGNKTTLGAALLP